MATRKVPKEVSSYVPEKLDFSGKALTQANLDKKLSHKREQNNATVRARVKTDFADKQLRDKKRMGKTFFKAGEENLPVDLERIYADNPVEELDPAVIKKLLPKGIGKNTAAKITEMINEAVKGMDSVMGEHMRDNCVSWINATKKTTMSAEQYINAVKFVTYKMSGDSNVKAYAKAFPERVTRLAKEGCTNEYLSIYANAYAKGKIVNEIHAMALIPTHLMYQDYFHLAVKTQVEIMTNPNVNPKTRSDAANSLMTHLKTPEIKKAELDITVKETDTISELRDVLGQLSKKQAQDVEEGEYKVIDVSYQKIIENQDSED